MESSCRLARKPLRSWYTCVVEGGCAKGDGAEAVRRRCWDGRRISGDLGGAQADISGDLGGAQADLGRCWAGVGPVSGRCRAGVGPEAGGEGRATLTKVATNGVLSTRSCTAVLLSPSRHSGERKRVRNDGFFISCANTPSGSCGAMLSMACRKATPAASPTSRSLDPPSLSPPSPPERAPKVDAGAAGVSCSIRPADSAAASSNSCTAGWMRPVRASPWIRTSILQW